MRAAAAAGDDDRQDRRAQRDRDRSSARSTGRRRRCLPVPPRACMTTKAAGTAGASRSPGGPAMRGARAAEERGPIAFSAIVAAPTPTPTSRPGSSAHPADERPGRACDDRDAGRHERNQRERDPPPRIAAVTSRRPRSCGTSGRGRAPRCGIEAEVVGSPIASPRIRPSGRPDVPAEMEHSPRASRTWRSKPPFRRWSSARSRRRSAATAAGVAAASRERPARSRSRSARSAR